jgi:hypothetical protein
MQFTDEDRLIFGPYPNGELDSQGQPLLIHGDPLRIHRRLAQSLEGSADRILRDIHAADAPCSDEAERWAREQLAYAATEKMLRAVIFAFELKPFEPLHGRGLKEAECMGVLNAFLDWMDTVKKKDATPPSLPQPTASLAPQSATPNGSVSISIVAPPSPSDQQRPRVVSNMHLG